MERAFLIQALMIQELVLDEDPDNLEALHAVHILLGGLSYELTTLLEQALSSIEAFLEHVSQGSAERGECFWQNLSAQDINPRMLAAFLHHLVASVSLFASVATSISALVFVRFAQPLLFR